MTPETNVAVAILDYLSTGLMIKSAALRDPNLLPALSSIIERAFKDERVTMARFCEWWAQHSHEQHAPDPVKNPWVPRGFWKCENPLCLSLLGTIHELMRGERLHPPTPKPPVTGAPE